jgi:hypothetical protein
MKEKEGALGNRSGGVSFYAQITGPENIPAGAI